MCFCYSFYDYAITDEFLILAKRTKCNLVNLRFFLNKVNTSREDNKITYVLLHIFNLDEIYTFLFYKWNRLGTYALLQKYKSTKKQTFFYISLIHDEFNYNTGNFVVKSTLICQVERWKTIKNMKWIIVGHTFFNISHLNRRLHSICSISFVCDCEHKRSLTHKPVIV